MSQMNNDAIEQLLTKGTDAILVRENLEKKLRSGKKLRIYLGIDPSGPELHFGHASVMRKLREFQDLGHTVIFLIGDYTGLIGDPTGKSQTRIMLTHDDISKNMARYQEQAAILLDINKVEFRRNSEWFKTLSFDQVLELTSVKTVAQFLQREDFKKRFHEQRDISLVEFLYPIMQGYDAYMLKADIQIGGSDQLFNMLVGRDIQEFFGEPPLDVITVPLLEGLDGKEKMSKSLNNYIAIEEKPNDMFGKIMSIPDHLIYRYYELLTAKTKKEIDSIKKAIHEGENPRDHKLQLAWTITAYFHSVDAANRASDSFIRQFQKKELPEDIREIIVNADSVNPIPIIRLLTMTKLCTSNSEARRMIQQGAVSVNQKRIKSELEQIFLDETVIIKVGKRNFCRVSLKNT